MNSFLVDMNRKCTKSSQKLIRNVLRTTVCSRRNVSHDTCEITGMYWPNIRRSEITEPASSFTFTFTFAFNYDGLPVVTLQPPPQRCQRQHRPSSSVSWLLLYCSVLHYCIKLVGPVPFCTLSCDIRSHEITGTKLFLFSQGGQLVGLTSVLAA